MSISRHEVRVSAMKLIYESLLRDDTLPVLYAIAEEHGEIPVTDAVRELTDGVAAHRDELDALIQQYSPKRAVSRIPKLLHAILLIAVFEILYDEKTPDNAAISEALLVCEEYSYFPEDVRFLNGLLGALVRGRQTAQDSPEV